MKLEKVKCNNCGHIGYPDIYHNDTICEKCTSRRVFENYKKQKKDVKE